jgi:hypothetical protein
MQFRRSHDWTLETTAVDPFWSHLVGAPTLYCLRADISKEKTETDFAHSPSVRILLQADILGQHQTGNNSSNYQQITIPPDFRDHTDIIRRKRKE